MSLYKFFNIKKKIIFFLLDFDETILLNIDYKIKKFKLLKLNYFNFFFNYNFLYPIKFLLIFDLEDLDLNLISKLSRQIMYFLLYKNLYNLKDMSIIIKKNSKYNFFIFDFFINLFFMKITFFMFYKIIKKYKFL